MANIVSTVVAGGGDNGGRCECKRERLFQLVKCLVESLTCMYMDLLAPSTKAPQTSTNAPALPAAPPTAPSGQSGTGRSCSSSSGQYTITEWSDVSTNMHTRIAGSRCERGTPHQRCQSLKIFSIQPDATCLVRGSTDARHPSVAG